jgi:hypothetical protein
MNTSKTKRTALIGASMLTAMLGGCGEPGPNTMLRDQCLRQQIFLQCMAALPAGPTAAHYNDWAEVVDSCESVAAYQALRPAMAIKKECRA